MNINSPVRPKAFIDIQGLPNRPGPEADLVMDFVELLVAHSDIEAQRTIFLEPNILGSRPDILVVDWDYDTIANWPKARQALSNTDLQLIHLLFLTGGGTFSDIESQFSRNISSSIDRLLASDILALTDRSINLRKLDEIYAVKRIMTFEAKIGSISRAIQQAFWNTWFSSQSFVLAPYRKLNNEMTNKLVARRIGIWFSDDPNPALQPVDLPLPLSYGSWLVNELIWCNSSGCCDDN